MFPCRHLLPCLAKLHHLLNSIAGKGGDIRVVYTTGHWLDVDSVEDVVAAGSFA